MAVQLATAENDTFSMTVVHQSDWHLVYYDSQVYLYAYSMNSSVDYATTSWRIYGTNDNTTYSVLDNQTGISLQHDVPVWFLISCPVAIYQYYYVDFETGFTNATAPILVTFDTYSGSLTANFTANQTEGAEPLAVQFTDTTTGDFMNWNWSFGDGTFSSLENPEHTYTAFGNYTVALNASNPYTFDIETKINYISVWETTAANFTSNKTEGATPLHIGFTDTSTGNVTAWNWSFGEGNFSILKNPSFTFLNPGTYTITLNATNGHTFDIETKTDYITVYGAVIPDFTANQTEGAEPLGVQFTDNSTGGAVAWNWSFGDGTFSSLENPEHTYTAFGNYTVALNASNPFSFNTETKVNYISVWETTAANFTSNVTQGIDPVPVQFTDTSTGNVTAWNWSFGDGFYSTEQSPIHVYSTWGVFTVSLNATNGHTFDIETKTNYLTIAEMLYTDFTSNASAGCSPLSKQPEVVQFTDLTNNATSWNWSFGDGNFSESQNPVHIYEMFGTFTVQLRANNSIDSNTTTKTNYLTVYEAPNAEFTQDVTTGAAPLTVQFTDLSNNATSWSWDFGNGYYSILRDPSTVYVTPGDYTVNLTATRCTGNSTISKTNLIHVLAPGGAPVVKFTANTTCGMEPLAVQFTDQSTGNVTTWNWSFGDTSYSTDQNPVHQYLAYGTYSVTLAAAGSGGANSTTKTNYISVSEIIIPDFIGVPTNLQSGQFVQFTDTSTGSTTSWLWNFGDTGSSALQNPLHQYNAVGIFDVSLTAGNGACGYTNSTTKVGYINVTAAPPPTPTPTPMPGTGFFKADVGETWIKWEWNSTESYYVAIDGKVLTEESSTEGVYDMSQVNQGYFMYDNLQPNTLHKIELIDRNNQTVRASSELKTLPHQEMIFIVVIMSIALGLVILYLREGLFVIIVGAFNLLISSYGVALSYNSYGVEYLFYAMIIFSGAFAIYSLYRIGRESLQWW